MPKEGLNAGACSRNRITSRTLAGGSSPSPGEIRVQRTASSKSRSIFATAWNVVREPMFLLLLSCGAIYLVLGDVQEALMLLGFVFVVLGITLFQERKTERALEALRDLSSPRALVIRDGERTRIAGRDVVPDDLVVLAEGDRVPADSVVLSCENLSTDESLLTGESVAVRKVAWDGVREMTPALAAKTCPCLLRHLDRAGPGCRQSAFHWNAYGDGQYRQGFADGSSRKAHDFKTKSGES